MKTAFTFLIVLLSLQLSFAGQTAYVVSYSPDNPEVGDLVTFTITNTSTLCSYQVDPDADDATVLFSALPGASHTYTAPGTYTVSLDEQCVTALKAPVGAGFWQLQNSSGVISANKTITIAAPGTGAPVPTMGEWGIIGLVIILLICSTVAFKMRANQSSVA